MSKLNILVIILSLFLTFCESNAQSLYLSIGGGYSSASPQEFYSVMINYISTYSSKKDIEVIKRNYFDKGYNLFCALNLKLPTLPFHIKGGLSYTKFIGKSDSVRATPPPWSSVVYEICSLELHSTITSIFLGAEWDIVDNIITPYLFFDILLNNFNKKNIKLVNHYDSQIYDIETNVSTKGGIFLGPGVRYNIDNLFTLNAQTGYCAHNIIGREKLEIRGIEHKESLQDGFIIQLAIMCRIL